MARQSYPWDDIPIPRSERIFEARKFDPTSTAEFYWAVDQEGHCAAILQFTDRGESQLKLPQTRSLAVNFHSDSPSYTLLVFSLLDASLKPVFFDFCQSLAKVILSAPSAEEAAKRAVGHAWLWQRFLQGKSAQLSEEEQRGLIGELIFLEEYLVPSIGWHTAVEAWLGPLGNPKDFQWNTSAVEVKTRLVSSRPYISITSEFQLDHADVDSLFLFLIEFSPCAESEPDGISVSDAVKRLRAKIIREAPASLALFDMRLNEFSYRNLFDDSYPRWLIGKRLTYSVENQFPTITAANLPHGIDQVTYRVYLPDIDEWIVDTSDLLTGSVDGD